MQLLRAITSRPGRSLAVFISLFFWITLFRIMHLRSLPPSQPQDPYYGTLDQTSPTSRYAIATFLTEDTTKSLEDGYFLATRILTYQLLHAPTTRISAENAGRIDWLVLVTSSVSEANRQRLTRDGAKVVEVEDVPLRWWIKTGITRWKDQFTKLRLLQMTAYARVLFVDADTILTGRIDGIFDEEAGARVPARTREERRRRDETPYPAQYVFLARPDNDFLGHREHDIPPELHNSTDAVSAGFWLAAPSLELYEHLMGVMKHWRRFDPTTMEQALLNYVFRPDGPMPWGRLDWKWSATWPSPRDKEAGVRSLHEKLWKTGPDELRELWRDLREEMERYWENKES